MFLVYLALHYIFALPTSSLSLLDNNSLVTIFLPWGVGVVVGFRRQDACLDWTSVSSGCSRPRWVVSLCCLCSTAQYIECCCLENGNVFLCIICHWSKEGGGGCKGLHKVMKLCSVYSQRWHCQSSKIQLNSEWLQWTSLYWRSLGKHHSSSCQFIRLF